MSYFSQSQKKSSIQPNLISPSPFRYNPKPLIGKPSCAQTPFGSTAKLDRSITNKKQNDSYGHQVEAYSQYQTVINDISGILPKQQKLSSNFISKTERFQTKTITTPGPGNYDFQTQTKRSLSKQKFLQLKRHNNISLSTSRMKVPSIPSDHLGYRQDQNNNMKKVEASPIVPPHPGSYDIKSTIAAKSNGIVKWKNQIKKPSRSVANLPGPGSYEILNSSQLKAPASSFISESKRFTQGKISQPGPGAYNILLNKKSHSTNKQGNFNSKTARFTHNSKLQNVGPGQYFNSVRQRVKAKSVTSLKTKLNAKQNTQQSICKKTIFYEKNYNPGPGQYANTQGMTLKLQKQLFRKFNDTTLPKEKRALFEISKSAITPGPGAYVVNTTQKKIEQQNQTLIKSNKKLPMRSEVVNLKNYDNQVTPSPFDYGNYTKTIAQKINQYENRMTLTDVKPFGVGQERFKHYDNKNLNKKNVKYFQQEGNQLSQINGDLGYYESNNKVKKLVMTNLKVKVPFGSSSSKHQSSVISQSPGKFYSKEQPWVRKSHNIRSKLN